MGTSFHGGLAGKPERRLICQGLMCGRKFWNGCLSIQRPHSGTWGGGPSNGNFKTWMKGAIGWGVSLQRGSLRRAPLLGTLGSERKALGTGISLHGCSVRQLGVGSSTTDFG